MTSVEWWDGSIITREGRCAVLGYRNTNTGIVIRPRPRLQKYRVVLESLLVYACFAVTTLFVRLPRPLSLTIFAGWVLARMVLARAWPQIARTVVLDDETLRVEASTPVARAQLIARSDIRAVVAESGSVLVQHRGGHLVLLALGVLTDTTAREIALLLEEALVRVD